MTKQTRATATVTLVRVPTEFSLGFQGMATIGTCIWFKDHVSDHTLLHRSCFSLTRRLRAFLLLLTGSPVFYMLPFSKFSLIRENFFMTQVRGCATAMGPIPRWCHEEESGPAPQDQAFFQSERSTGPSVSHPAVGRRVPSRCLLIQHFKFTNKTALSWTAGSG